MLVGDYASGERQKDPIVLKAESVKSLEELSAELKALAENQSKILENTEVQQEKTAASKQKAAQIKAVLQHKLENGDHSEEVNAHLKYAIERCDSCINASDDEHHAVAEHLAAAHGHVHKANEKHPVTSCNHHHGKHSHQPHLAAIAEELKSLKEHQHS